MRPSADYFNSNLMGYNYVVSDVSAGKNYVYYYDERHQGKGADALCSLRMRYHLKKVRQFYDEGLSPVLSMSLPGYYEVFLNAFCSFLRHCCVIVFSSGAFPHDPR